jgi:LPS-assembly lipoprotein
MSSPERVDSTVNVGFARLGVGLGLLLSVMAVSACTVRPLYSTAPASTSGTASMAAELSSISIKPVSTRYAQEVRNNLIFLLNGGAGQPSSPAYTLDLNVVRRVEVAATIQVTTTDDEPTASTVTMIGIYSLKKVGTGEVVAKGRREVMSSFDVPRQEFAAQRAQRDAENRSSRELAELLRMSIGQDIASK